MSAKILYAIIAGVAGVTMAIQGTLNSALGKHVGIWGSNFAVHIIGTILVSIIIFGFKMHEVNWQQFTQAPWYTYLGGILNVLIILGVVVSIPKIGVGNATTIILVFQVLTAVTIDHFGLFGMEKVPCKWWDLLGIALLGTGAKVLLQ